MISYLFILSVGVHPIKTQREMLYFVAIKYVSYLIWFLF